MRRTVLALLTALAVVLALGVAAVAGGGGSTVTRARLERALPVAFTNLYVQQAHLMGRHDVTTRSLHAQAMCDKHGPDVADVGPGGDWVCLMSWQDPEVPMPPEGYGKFELNVHSNDCFTAGGPTKLTGYLEMTDAKGRTVTNPVFEFDGCFDPNSDDAPTGNSFPSLLSVTSTTVTASKDGSFGLGVGCGTGAAGCAGTVTATAGGRKLGSVPFHLKEEATGTVPFSAPLPPKASEVTFTVHMTTGAGPSSPSSLPVQRAG
ncbi:MAG: hypothetical protein ACJ72B_00020 [Ornithinibacter sp.]